MGYYEIFRGCCTLVRGNLMNGDEKLQGSSITKMQDPTYLREQQYRTPDNLRARIRLHARFSTNTYGWFRWVFDHFDLPEGCRILELGCGPGDLWQDNANRIPNGWEIALSDLSEGMVTQAQQNLAGCQHTFTYAAIDAQGIPFEGDCFDAVIANHCLYHFPDRGKALSEIQRVLVPAGRFYTTTVGARHLGEFEALVGRFDPSLVHVFSTEEIDFTLEDGEPQLASWFTHIKCVRYPDSLVVTAAEPLVDFVLSGIRFGMDEKRRAAFTAFVTGEIKAGGGVLHIQKDSGLFTAQNPQRSHP